MQYAAIAGAFTLLALAKRRYPPAALFAAALLVNLAYIAAVAQPRAARPATPHVARSWSLLTYNTWRRNEDWPAVRAVIERNAPDVWVLEEVTGPVEQGALASGSAVAGGGIVIGVTPGSKASLIGPAPLPTGIEGALAVRIELDGQRVLVVGVHLEAPLSARAVSQRERTALALAAWIRARKEPVIVLGDFNASPWSRTFTRFRAASGLVDSEAGLGIARTWPAHQPRWLTWAARIPIDHCFFDPRLTALDRSAGEGGRSNHLPLLVRLALVSPEPR